MGCIAYSGSLAALLLVGDDDGDTLAAIWVAEEQKEAVYVPAKAEPHFVLDTPLDCLYERATAVRLVLHLVHLLLLADGMLVVESMSGEGSVCCLRCYS